MQALKVSHLIKTFGQFTAVDDISFSISKGEVVGLLGPNGAGKTTTIQMLIGVTTQTSGMIEYFGKDFGTYTRESLSRINFSSAFNHLQGRITVLENLKVYAGLYSIANPKKRIDEIVSELSLHELLQKQYKELSAGQKTRVNIAKSLLNSPELLLMDEPTASLDPDVADRLLSFIEKLTRNHNTSILFTSHNMAEVARICNRVIFLDKGKIVAEDTPLGLTKRVTHATVILTFDGTKQLLQEYGKEHNIEMTFLRKQVVSCKVEERQIPKVIFGLSKRGLYMTDIEIHKPDLEDVFLSFARNI